MKKVYLSSEKYERNYRELARDVALLENIVTRLLGYRPESSIKYA